MGGMHRHLKTSPHKEGFWPINFYHIFRFWQGQVGSCSVHRNWCGIVRFDTIEYCWKISRKIGPHNAHALDSQGIEATAAGSDIYGLRRTTICEENTKDRQDRPKEAEERSS